MTITSIVVYDSKGETLYLLDSVTQRSEKLGFQKKKKKKKKEKKRKGFAQHYREIVITFKIIILKD